MTETPAAPEPTIGVVVCTHLQERYDQLLACLDSVATQRRPAQQVVVVVDGEPAVAAALAERAGPERVVALPRNGGLSAARNAGVAELHTTWVAFLDDDALADPGWLEALLTACTETGAVGAGGWSEPLWVGDEPRWWPRELNWAVGCSYAGLPQVRTRVRNVLGGCCLLQHRLFDLVGGFDPQLGRQVTGAGAGEETDFCLRVVAVEPSATFVQEPAAVIRHRVPAERTTLAYLLERCFAEGQAKASVARSQQSLRVLSAEGAFVGGLAGRVVAHLKAGRGGGRRAGVLLIGVAATGLGFGLGLLGPRRPGGLASATTAASGPGTAA